MPIINIYEARIPLNAYKLLILLVKAKPKERERVEEIRIKKEIKKDINNAKRTLTRIIYKNNKNSNKVKAAAEIADYLYIRIN